MTKTLGFVGAGKMATALAGGLVNAGVATAQQIIVYDTYTPALEAAKKCGYRTAGSNAEVVTNSDVTILAVKPEYFPDVTADITAIKTTGKLIVSIMTGISINMLQKLSNEQLAVVRVMPNTPCLVGASAAAFCVNKVVSDADKQFVRTMLSAVGICEEVTEDKLDAVTGLSGSGPAYVYMLIEGMADAGVKAGLTRDVATRLAAQTVVGAGQMVLQTGVSPADLRSDVCSPAGTTISAVQELERLGLRYAGMRAVEVACERSKEKAKAAEAAAGTK